MLKHIALTCIGLYQSYISPYKGYNCAYRIATGEVGCSGYGKKVISRFGLITGLKLLKRRLSDCSCQYHALSSQHHKRSQFHSKQGGFIDGGCDIGDAGGCDGPCTDASSDMLCCWLETMDNSQNTTNSKRNLRNKSKRDKYTEKQNSK